MIIHTYFLYKSITVIAQRIPSVLDLRGTYAQRSSNLRQNYAKRGLEECSVFVDFSLTVKAAPHECVIRTGQP